jgi:hypothetical protein
MKRVFVVIVTAVALVSPAAPAQAAPPATTPVDLVGEIGGAPFEIRVPANWNGTLVLHAHGYRDRADHPGEVDDRSVSAFVNDATEQAMLAAGYAIAGSAYSVNGWAVREGIKDMRALAAHFRQVVGKPSRTLLAGVSMGSVIALDSIEDFHGTYDGALALCAVAAGTPLAFDGTLAVASAYDAVFGWPAAWGTPADVRDDIDFESEVVPVLVAQLTAPGGLGRFEFMRLAAHVPSGPEWPFGIFYFATEGRGELEGRAGGPVAQNADHTYSLTDADRARLAGLGISGPTADGWIADMMSNRGSADPAARRYAERYAQYSGNIKDPVLTMDTTVDALVPPAHISVYNETVHRPWLVANAWTSGVGHCNFTIDQLVTAVTALDNWARTADRPTSFPTAQGFVDFTPPPWPYPTG